MKTRQLTKLIKSSIIWKGGMVFLVSVLKRFRAFTKTPTISSLSNLLPRKDLRMKTKKFFASTRGRLAGALALVGITLALVACGGGGGGSTTPTPPVITPTGTLSVAPATCTVQAGLGKCTATATFATTNATTAKLTNAGGAVLSSSLSGTQVVDVLIGSNTYSLSANGGGAVATASATGVCVVSTASNGTICVSPVTATLSVTSPVMNGAKSTLTWGYTGDAPTGCTTSVNWSNGGILSGSGLSNALTTNTTFTYSCTNANGTTTANANVTVCAVGDTVVGGVCTAPAVFHYTDKVYAIWTGGQVFSVTKTSATRLTNITSYTAGFFPLANCWLPSGNVGILADGKILSSCQDAMTLHRHYLYIDPSNESIHEYAGAVPATLQCTENANLTWTCPVNTDWISVQTSLPIGAPANASIAVHTNSDGWYFSSQSDGRSIFLLNTSGITSIVRQGVSGIDDVVKLLMTYSF
jgi:hypothetical protein